MNEMRRFAVLLLLAITAGCGDGGGAAPAATVRDSAGIAIVENVFPDSADAEWWTVEAEPLVDIGSVDGDEESALFRVGDALRLSDGRIAVTNGGAADVRYYSSDGAHLRTTGRRGEGPGEFQNPGGLHPLGGDSVLVIDGRRASVLDAEGEFAREFIVGGASASVSAIGRLTDGSLIATASMLDIERLSDGFQRPNTGLVRLSADGIVLDTIVIVPGMEGRIRRGGTARRQTLEISLPPFAKRTVYAAAGDAIVVGTQDAPQVEIYDQDGTLRRIVRTGADLVPVTDAHLEAYYQRQLSRMPADLAAQFTKRPDYADFGSVVPPYGAVEFDDDGNLWIQDYDDPTRAAVRWSVHDAEGRLLARVALPDGFRPMHIGRDFVLGVERDELDVEHVRLYRLRRTSS